MLDSVKLGRFVHFEDKGINVLICEAACTAFCVVIPTSCLINALERHPRRRSASHALAVEQWLASVPL